MHLGKTIGVIPKLDPCDDLASLVEKRAEPKKHSTFSPCDLGIDFTKTEIDMFSLQSSILKTFCNCNTPPKTLRRSKEETKPSVMQS